MNKNLPRGQYDGAPEAPMDQVREILFGAQLKDMEMRFKRQEERLLREISDVKDSLRKRLDSLENFMKSEVTALLGRLKEEGVEREASIKTEQRERTEAIKNEQRERSELLANERREMIEAVAREQRERSETDSRLASDLALANENYERRASKIAAALDSTERELRELLMTESGSLNDKIEEKFNNALIVIDKTQSQIRSDMVYRTALSTMLTGMVANLSQPWNIDVPNDETSEVVDVESEAVVHEGDGQNQPENYENHDNNQY